MVDMTTARTLTTQSARALAARFRRSPHHGYGASTAVDRDLARETHELVMASQFMHSRR